MALALPTSFQLVDPVKVGGDIILHPAVQPINDVSKAFAFVVADQELLVLWFHRPADKAGLHIDPGHMEADLH